MKQLITFLFLLIAPAAFAQESQPLSVDQCIAYAMTHSNAAKNADLAVLIQKAKNQEITAISLPHISGSGQFTDYINPVTTFVPADFTGGPAGTFVPVVFTPKFGNTAGFNGSQLLFDASVLVALKARNELVHLAEQSAQLSKQDIRYNVIRAYYALVIANRQFNNLKAAMRLARDADHDVQVLRQNGMAEQIEVDRSSVQVNNLATDSIRIANLMEVSEQLLKFQMGMPVYTPIVLTDTAINQQIIAAQQMLANEVNYKNRVEFGLVESQLRLREYDVKRYKYAGLPSLSAFGGMSWNYSSNKFSELFTEHYIFTSMAGLTLNVPVFDGFARRSRLRQAMLEVERSRNDLAQTQQVIDFQSAQTRTILKNALLALISQEHNVDLAMNVLDLARRKYKAGVGSNFEVTQAQGDLLRTQNNYFVALLDAINAQTDLEKALGTAGGR